MTTQETLEKEVDISGEVVTVARLIEVLSKFDQTALVLMADESQPINLEFYKVVQTSQEGCSGQRYNTVYLQVED